MFSPDNLYPEGTIATQGQKFIWKNGMWKPYSKSWFKVENTEQQINQKRKVIQEKKQQKAKVEMEKKINEFKSSEVNESGF